MPELEINETRLESCEETQKSQLIRLVDVFIVGPIILFAAFKISNIWLKIILVIIGISTIWYNGRYYFINKDKLNKISSNT